MERMRDEGDGEAGREGEESKLATDNRHNNNALKPTQNKKTNYYHTKKSCFKQNVIARGERKNRARHHQPAKKRGGRDGDALSSRLYLPQKFREGKL